MRLTRDPGRPLGRAAGSSRVCRASDRPRRRSCETGSARTPRSLSWRLMALRDLQARIVACRRCPRLVRFREAVAASPPRRFRDQTYWARPVPSLGERVGPASPGGPRARRPRREPHRAHVHRRRGGRERRVGGARASRPRLRDAATSHQRGDGFRLVEAYITAALHCVPPDNRPAPIELRRCARYLREELPRLAEVRVVLGLGRIGFDAYLGAAARHGAARAPATPPIRARRGRRPALGRGACSGPIIRAARTRRRGGSPGRCSRPCSPRPAVAWGRADHAEAGRPVRASQRPRTTRLPPATVKTDRGSPSHTTPSSAPTSGWTFR